MLIVIFFVDVVDVSKGQRLNFQFLISILKGLIVVLFLKFLDFTKRSAKETTFMLLKARRE